MPPEIRGPQPSDRVDTGSPVRPSGASLDIQPDTALPTVSKSLPPGMPRLRPGETIVGYVPTPGRQDAAHRNEGVPQPPSDSASGVSTADKPTSSRARTRPAIDLDDETVGLVRGYVDAHPKGAVLTTIAKHTGLPLSTVEAATEHLVENGTAREVQKERAGAKEPSTQIFPAVDGEEQRAAINRDRVLSVMGERGTPLALRHLNNDIAIDPAELNVAVNHLFEEGVIEGVGMKYVPGTGKKEMFYRVIPEDEREPIEKKPVATVSNLADARKKRGAK